MPELNIPTTSQVDSDVTASAASYSAGGQYLSGYSLPSDELTGWE